MPKNEIKKLLFFQHKTAKKKFAALPFAAITKKKDELKTHPFCVHLFYFEIKSKEKDSFAS